MMELRTAVVWADRQPRELRTADVTRARGWRTAGAQDQEEHPEALHRVRPARQCPGPQQAAYRVR